MKRLTTLLFLALAVTVSAYSQNRIAVGAAAPAFTAMSMDGTSYALSDLRGSVVVVTFWSTKCLICHAEIPKLNGFTSRFDAKKVVFLALTMENEEKVNKYIKANPFNFQILPNSFGTLMAYADRDKGGNLNIGFPSFYVIDQGGLVQYRSSGYDKTPQLEAAINKLLLRQ
jgi:peroxiredoxin